MKTLSFVDERRAALCFALMLLGLPGCGSNSATNGPDGADGGAATDAEVAGDATGGMTDADSGYGALGDASAKTDGGQSCDNPLDRAGCPCPGGSAPRSCYTGKPSQAGVGACVMGKQSCVNQTESGGTWGPCTDSGMPTTCAATSSQCGTIPDGCGGVLDCGMCSSGLTCSSRQGGSGNVCGMTPCTPKTCASLGDECGPASDGCGGTLDCGTCPAGETCGGAGVPNQCGCTPTTCAALGDNCGSVPDGCGGTLDCGRCPSRQTCGGGGVPNECGCTPTTCAALGDNCGSVPDGCGGTLDCGTCASGQTCGGGGTPNHCGATSDSCRHLALTYDQMQSPATVCLLASDGTLQCALTPAMTGTGGELLPASPLSNLACISGGEDFFCAVTTTGSVVCWGDRAAFDPAWIGNEPLGDINNVTNETLTIPGVQSAIDVAAGESHVCVLTAGHTVMCWGNGEGEQNIGHWPLPASPTAVDIGGAAVDIASGDGFSCALRDDGVILCWGNNDNGELGNGTTTGSATPVPVTGLPTSAVGVWADQSSYPCALLQDGSVWCWGGSTYANTTLASPKQVTGFSGPVTALTVGGEQGVYCALMATGGVQCWSGSGAPADVLPAGSGVVELRSVDFDYCALSSSGNVTCWFNLNEWYGGDDFTAPVTVPGL